MDAQDLPMERGYDPGPDGRDDRGERSSGVATMRCLQSDSDSSRGGGGGERLSSFLCRIILLLIPLFAFVLGVHQLKGGWDDGAITAAFSRTLAESGRFALTPLSEKVEGFSSVTWVFLLAVPYYIFHSATSILVWMKLLSAACFLASLVVVRRLAKRLLASSVDADLATVLAALVASPLLETLNGMEMNLYMLLVLCLVDALTDKRKNDPRGARLWILTMLLVATRFESPYLIVASIIGLVVARERASLLKLTMAVATAFGAMELWRYHEFGWWMPNTVYAKMRPPYYPPHLLVPMFNTRLLAASEMSTVLGGPLLGLLLVVAIAALWKYLPLPRTNAVQRIPVAAAALIAFLFLVQLSLPHFDLDLLTRNELFLPAGIGLLAIAFILPTLLFRGASCLETQVAAMVAAGAAFGLIFGKNWGYPGRMILPCLPFLVLAVAYVVERHIPSAYWRKVALVGCVLCQLLAWMPIARKAWAEGSPISEALIEKTGMDADAVRRLAGLDRLSVLLPDVGGSSLCCDKLEILDSALLANTYLAHHGYAASSEYMREHNPQVIETHGIWTPLMKVYRTGFIQNYQLAIVGPSRLLLRDDVYSRVYARLRRTSEVRFGIGSQCMVGIDPSYPIEDAYFVMARQRCLYISPETLRLEGIPTNE